MEELVCALCDTNPSQDAINLNFSLHSFLYIRTLKNLAEPEDVLISAHTFS